MFLYYLDLAWRSLKKTPFLSSLMVLAISIGVGITITSLNIYKMASVNPAGDRSGQLYAVQLWSQEENSWDEFNEQITYQDGINLRKSDIPVRHAMLLKTGLAVQTDNPDFAPILERVRVTNSDFFSLFDIKFIHGGAWDKRVDIDPAYQVVINQDLNQQLFGGENSVGKNVYLNRKPYQVVGVIENWNPSPKYYDLNNGAFQDSEQLFVPFSLAPIEEYQSWGNNQSWKHEDVSTYADRLASEYHWIQYWVELKDEQQFAQYQTWLASYIEQQKQLGRFQSSQAAARLMNVEQWLVENKVVAEDNKVLVGLSVLFLMVCLVNTLGLLLAKFLKRAPEVGVRRAIGASRAHIFSQHMVEVGLIGFAGGMLGLLWAWGALSSLSTRFDLEEALTQLDISMWIIAPSIAILAAVLAGLYPAWRVCATNPAIYLKSQ